MAKTISLNIASDSIPDTNPAVSPMGHTRKNLLAEQKKARDTNREKQ